eukprot:s2_g45.t1
MCWTPPISGRVFQKLPALDFFFDAPTARDASGARIGVHSAAGRCLFWVGHRLGPWPECCGRLLLPWKSPTLPAGQYIATLVSMDEGKRWNFAEMI